MNFPLQPLEVDDRGVVRFKANSIVRLLLDDGKYDMNRLALLPFTKEERMQFAQLIGYSVSGFGDLSYADPEVVRQADAHAKLLMKGIVVIAGATFTACQLEVENVMDGKPMAETTLPVRGADGNFYSQVRVKP